jgi:hypothetical protein
MARFKPGVATLSAEVTLPQQPELASPTPGFQRKDQVENYLHDQVCGGAIPLATAQQEIATNWLAVYHSMP